MEVNKLLFSLLLFSFIDIISGKIYQKISLDQIRVGVNETYQVPLNDVFSGPNLFFQVTGFYNSTTNIGLNPQTTPQFRTLASVSKNSGQFSGNFGQPQWFNSTNSFWAIDSSSFTFWNATNLINPTKIATVSARTGTGMSIFPKYHKDTGKTYLNSVSVNSYLTIYQVNVTDLTYPQILRQLRVENQQLSQVSWEDQTYQDEIWVAISNFDAGISAVYSIPYNTSQPITKKLQFDNAYINTSKVINIAGAGLYSGELFVCVKNQGIYQVNVVYNSTFLLKFPTDTDDSLDNCSVQGDNLFVTTKQATFMFYPPTLQVISAFYRNYADYGPITRFYYNQIYYQGLFYTYQEKFVESKSTKYFEVWNYYQTFDSALVASIPITSMFSSYDSADFPAFQIIPGVPNQVIFYARYAVYVVEVFPNPVMTINSGLDVPFDFVGNFRVSSDDDGYLDQLTLDISIQGVSVNSTDIYNYRGNLRDRGYVQFKSIESYMQNNYNETSFWIPLENYFVGQNITYMVTGNDTNFDIDIPNKYNLAETIQIEPDTFSSPYLSVKTVKFSNNATDYIALIDGDSINIYLYNFQTKNYTVYTTVCNDGDMQPNLVVLGDTEIATQSQVFVALECYAQNQDNGFDVSVQLYQIYDNQLNLVNKVQTSQIMYSTKMILQNNVIYCQRGRQIDTYLYYSHDNALVLGSSISIKNLTPQFDINPVDFVIDSNQGLLYAYDFNLGLIAIELGSYAQQFYHSFLLGQLQGFRNQSIKLYLNSNSLYLINPYSQDNTNLIKLDPNTDFVRGEPFNLTISETYPHIKNCRYQGVAFNQQFLAANCREALSTQILIFAINSPSFYQLYTSIPLERYGFIGMSSNSITPNLYVIQGETFKIYKVGQTFKNGEFPPTESSLIPSDNKEVTTWASVGIATTQNKENYFEQITITGQIGNVSQNATIALNIINQGQTPRQSNDFNPNTSELTKGQRLKVKKRRAIYAIPSDIAQGQAVSYEIVNNQTQKRFKAQQICSSSNGPFCTETKSFRYTQLSEADDIEVAGSNIYISANSTIIEYIVVNQNTTTIGRTYNLTKFGDEVICNYVRSIEQTDRFIIQCSRNALSTKQYFIAYIDFNQPNITAVIDIEYETEIIDVYQQYGEWSDIFICGKNFYEADVYHVMFDQFNIPSIVWFFYIDGSNLDISRLSISGLYHLPDNYFLLIIQNGYFELYSYVDMQLNPVTHFKLADQSYSGKFLSVAASTISSNRTQIYTIMQTGDIYRVDVTLDGSLAYFNQTFHIPSFNDDTIVTKATANLYQDTYLVFSLDYQAMAENSILIRLIDLSKSLYSIIYDDTVVSTDKEGGSSDDYFGRVIYYANGDDNFFITNLGYQDQMAKIYQYRYSLNAYFYMPQEQLLQSSETYSVYLAACNANSCTQLGQTFNVEFDDSSSSDYEVYRQWWFWFLIVLSGLAIVGIIILVLHFVRKKNAEGRKERFIVSDRDIEVTETRL